MFLKRGRCGGKAHFILVWLGELLKQLHKRGGSMSWCCSGLFSTNNRPAITNIICVHLKYSHARRNHIQRQMYGIKAYSCFGCGFCRSCPIETRHYSHTVNSYFLSRYFPTWSSDILAHAFEGTLAMDNLPMYGSSYDQCSKEDLIDIVINSNLLIRLIVLLELHSNLH